MNDWGRNATVDLWTTCDLPWTLVVGCTFPFLLHALKPPLTAPLCVCHSSGGSTHSDLPLTKHLTCL